MPRHTTVLIALACALALTVPTTAATATSSISATSPKVTVTPSKPKVMRGKTVKLTVKVKGHTGKVKVYRGSKKVKTLTLRGGKATYKTPKTLKRGKHKFKFVHTKTGKSRTVNLIVRSKATISATASPATFSREGTPGKLKLKATADGKATNGVFTVSEGIWNIAFVETKSGKATVTLPTKLSKGKHTFTVEFLPASKYVKAPSKKKVTVTVTSEAAFAGDGMFVVGADVKPGLYVSRGNKDCYWARFDNFSGDITSNDLGSGDRYVRVKSTDKMIETVDCNDFVPAPTTRAPKTTIPGDGQYRIGYDLAPGIYRSDDASDDYCYWARRSDATGEFKDLIDNDSGGGRRIVEVLATDLLLETSSCSTWTKIG